MLRYTTVLYATLRYTTKLLYCTLSYSAAQIYPNQNIRIIRVSPISVYVYAHTNIILKTRILYTRVSLQTRLSKMLAETYILQLQGTLTAGKL